MNAQLFSFCLFVLWTSVALVAVVLGPAFFPRMFGDGSQFKFIAIGAGLLAVWNLVKWWSIRQRDRTRHYRHQLDVDYRRRAGRPDEDEPKPVVNPEFDFDNTRPRNPPPPPPNGASHGSE